MIFNEKIINLRSQRFANKFEQNSQLYKIICDNFVDNLQDLTKIKADSFINLCNRSNYLTDLIQKTFNITSSDSADLILAPFVLHLINNPIDFLQKVAKKINQGGIFMGNFLGGQTLQELYSSFIEIESQNGKFYPHIIPMVDIKDAGKIMQLAGFKNIIVSSEVVTLNFKNCYSLMKWLQNCGESNCLTQQSKGFYGKKKLLSVCDHYDKKYQTKDGKIFASFEIIYVFGDII